MDKPYETYTRSSNVWPSNVQNDGTECIVTRQLATRRSIRNQRTEADGKRIVRTATLTIDEIRTFWHSSERPSFLL